PEMLKMFNEVTGSHKKQSSDTGKDAQAAAQNTSAVTAPQLVPGSQNPLVAGSAPVQQAAQKPPVTASTTPSQNLQNPGPKRDNPNPSKEQWPFPGQGAGRYPAENVVPSNPVTGYQQLPGSSTAPVQQTGPRAPVTASTTPSQNLQNPGPKRDNPNPSKEQWPFPGQGAGRYPAENVVPSNPVTGYQQLPGSSTAPVQQTGPRAPGPETRYAQNPEIPGSRFNNRDPSKEQRPPLLGQGPGGYPDANRFNQNPRPGIDIRGPVDGAGPGSETRFSQNQGPPVSRFNNPNPPKDQKSQMGQAVGRYPESDGRYNQNEAFPGPRTDSAGAPNKSGPPLGADAANRFNQNPPSRFDTREPVDGAGAGPGPITHFSQTPQVPVSRFDNPNVSKDSRSNVGQTAGRYLGSDGRYSQNEPYPGARTDNNGSFDKTRPPSGAGSEMRFSQNLQNPGPRFDNSNPSNQPKSMVGQAANRYQGIPIHSNTAQYYIIQRIGGDGGAEMAMKSNEPNTFYSQDEAYPGAWTKNNGSHDKTRPPIGADQQGNYKQTAWNSGPASGKQGFYNEAQPASGMGTGRYDGIINTSTPKTSGNPSTVAKSSMEPTINLLHPKVSSLSLLLLPGTHQRGVQTHGPVQLLLNVVFILPASSKTKRSTPLPKSFPNQANVSVSSSEDHPNSYSVRSNLCHDKRGVDCHPLFLFLNPAVEP
ncbi:unnamed protein product, partial [Ranitomeya imitator]